MAMRAHQGAGLAALVIGEDGGARRTLVAGLRGLGCFVAESATVEEARAMARGRAFDVAFFQPDEGATGGAVTAGGEQPGGLALLPSLLGINPRIEVVIVSASASLRTALETAQRGAHDFLPRPFTTVELRQLVERTAARRALERQVIDLRSQLGQSAPEADLETRSPTMRALFEVLGHAAAHDVAVLLAGDAGTGKSVLARRLHAMSPRRARPFVVVNCAALREERLGAVLFGRAGESLGVEAAGVVESATGGTLFLDEVAGIPPPIQARLLRLLDDGDFQRQGEARWRTADVRVVAATQVDLGAEAAAGRLRGDLLQRLDTVVIEVPPLRDRPEDIVPLAERFLAFFGRISPRGPLELSASARAALLAYPWPGNVRELRNAIERAVILAPTSRIGPELLPGPAPAHSAPTSGRSASATRRPFVGGDFTLAELEREHTARVMARTNSLDEAARILGVEAQALWRRRKRDDDR